MSTLVLLRHGQSYWNELNLFTGWVDVDLSELGERESHEAGVLLRDEPNLSLDVVYTSVLTRAVHTAEIALSIANRSYLPTHRHWRLNERHYGALQGLNKKETAEKFGLDQVTLWRRSYSIPPDPVEKSDINHPINDLRYATVPERALPATECLADVVKRAVPYFEDVIAQDLYANKTVLVVAHGNSIRALRKYIEEISDDDITKMEIPTGIPFVMHLDDKLFPTEQRYLGDQEAALAAAEAVRRQAG